MQEYLQLELTVYSLEDKFYAYNQQNSLKDKEKENIIVIDDDDSDNDNTIVIII